MNSTEFKRFKLHADSTLKSMTKDELIRYICKLNKALDKACEELVRAYPCGVNRCNTNCHKESWEEGLMKDE